MQVIQIPPEEEGIEKFDVAAWNAEIARIAYVGRTWLAAVTEARRVARKHLPNLSDAEKTIVYRADETAMTLITEGMSSMLNSKRLCEEKIEEIKNEPEPAPRSPVI